MVREETRGVEVGAQGATSEPGAVTMGETLRDRLLKLSSVLHWLGRFEESKACTLLARFVQAMGVRDLSELTPLVEAAEDGRVTVARRKFSEAPARRPPGFGTVSEDSQQPNTEQCPHKRTQRDAMLAGLKCLDCGAFVSSDEARRA